MLPVLTRQQSYGRPGHKTAVYVLYCCVQYYHSVYTVYSMTYSCTRASTGTHKRAHHYYIAVWCTISLLGDGCVGRERTGGRMMIV